MLRIAERLRDDRGVSAVVVVITLFVLFGAAVLAVDSGSLWTSRRGLITDTDAAALAAAQYLSDATLGEARCLSAKAIGMASDAGAEAGDALAANDAATSYDDFSVSDAVAVSAGHPCRAGQVRVEASHDAQLTFAGVFDVTDVDVRSVSIAQWGPLAAAKGLRPIGICAVNPHFVEWQAHVETGAPLGIGPDHPTYPGAGVVHRIKFDNDSSGCGSAAGNWDWIDFNGTTDGTGVTSLEDWLVDGYDREVSLGDTATGLPKDCNPEQAGNQENCPSKTGGTGNWADGELDYLEANDVEFPVLVYDKVVHKNDSQGCASTSLATTPGVNTRFCHVAFLMVELHGHVTTGVASNWYLDLEFIDTQWTGSIGVDPSPNFPTIVGTQLCGGDYNGSDDNNCDV